MKTPPEQRRVPAGRKKIPAHPSFLFLTLLTLAIFHTPLRSLLELSFRESLYSHIILVPAVSGYFFCLERKSMPFDGRPSFVAGAMVMVAGLILFLTVVDRGGGLEGNDRLSLMALAALVFWYGAFLWSYGAGAFKASLFPLLYLLFMIPLPSAVLAWLIHLLQAGSAEVAGFLFMLTGVPAMREGQVFHLPSLSIEVAEQCSGIRSTLVLFISSIIAGHVFLRRGWKKVLLSLSVFPVSVVKNGLRIVTLALLGEYVNETFLTNSLLHRNGGILFLGLAVLLLLPLLWVLARTDMRASRAGKN
ncbi:MAG: exosortase [DPANN group archaeon]|nr:exosortase [DPANN group archaeon]